MQVKLNSEQKAAVSHRNGPLLVIAGAGTGKTTVITERIKHIVGNDWANASEILALTFTDKAAKEMETRVDVALPLGYTQMWISTFHSFCDRVLRADGLAIGINTSYKLMTQGDSASFLKEHLYDFELNYFRPLGNPTKFIYGILQHFSRLQDEDVSPEQYYNFVNNKIEEAGSTGKRDDELGLELDKWSELALCYKKYRDLKIANDLMDFGDLIAYTVKLFRERPNVLKSYQNKFKYILVDEYQDTNIAQNDLVKLLAGSSANLTVVADDDQSIYKWRGAAVSNVIQFRKSFPKSKLVTLTKNYRSGQEILDKAYNLIQFNNPDRLEVVESIDKKLISPVKIQSEVKFVHKKRAEDEVEGVADIIQSLTKDAYKYSDIAILVRANSHASLFVEIFKRLGIPHQFLGPGSLFKTKDVAQVISYLRCIYDPDDSISLFSTLSIDEIGIDPVSLARLSGFARKQNLSLYEASKEFDKKKLIGKTKENLKEFLEMFEKHILESREKNAGQIVYSFLESTKLIKKYLNPENLEEQLASENIAKFFEKIRTFEVAGRVADIRNIIDWIDLLEEEGETPLAANSDWNENDLVNILTIHSAKGLEFPVVFLVNLVTQRFPSMERSEQIPIPDDLVKEILPKGDSHIQEERRLFYVGITRAKEKLYLTAADFYGEAKRAKKLSPFIFETLGEDIQSSENNDSVKKTEINYKSNSEKKAADKKKVHVDYLSYSQIQTFKTCPLHYKLKYLLQVPTPASAALSFGTAIHAVLNEMYVLAGKGDAVDKKVTIELLNKNWINAGFLHKKHEDEYKEKGREYLMSYLKKNFDAKNLPIYLEFPFTASLGDGKKESLKIGGKIDRIDKLSGGKIEIIDYKTGENIPTQKEVDKNEQLTFYALAASKLRDPELGVDPKNIKLSLFYLEDQTKISTSRTKEELNIFEKEILDIKSQIESSDFACNGGFWCQNCEYRSLCHTK